ncbi:branched-chain amino acid ABC transporter permease [uncultured Enterovirga sp.]|uniref:branched-chain amino acid ABC transporter permease n=1 Tax=uncultured Enterovirga sp. TaxID=2026352 RepID=UPI0035CB3548
MEAYAVAIGIVALIYVLMALGLTLQFGLAGLINFGVVGFFAVGAYASALLTQLGGWPLPVTFFCASLLAGAVAVPLGLVSLRLRDDYFAIITLGFSETVRIAASSEVWLTGGVRGLAGVPRLFQGWAPGRGAQLLTLALAAAAALVTAIVVQRIARSPFGRIIEAIRDNEPAVASIGKDPAMFKVKVFVVGSIVVGFAGALYGHYIGFVAPDQFAPIVTFYVWVAVVLGGVGRVSGAIVGTALLLILLEGSRFVRDVFPAVSEVEMASLRLGLVGLALILLMIYRPTGLMGDYSTDRK